MNIAMLAIHNLYHNYKEVCKDYLKKYKNLESIPYYTPEIHNCVVDMMKEHGDYKKEYENSNIISGRYISDQITSECEVMSLIFDNVLYDVVEPELHIIKGEYEGPGAKYLDEIKKKCNTLGIKTKDFHWNNIKDVEVYVDKNKKDTACFLIQRPFCDELVGKTPKIRELLKRLNNYDLRDVDGFLSTPYDVPDEIKTICNIPATADAVFQILSRVGIKRNHQNVLILGQSPWLGIPLATLLQKLKFNVSSYNSKINGLDLRYSIINADIIITATGSSKVEKAFYFGDMENKIIIDVGMFMEDGKLRGDLKESTKKRFLAYTPTPGGVGSVTISVLMSHILESTLLQIKRNGGLVI